MRDFAEWLSHFKDSMFVGIELSEEYCRVGADRLLGLSCVGESGTRFPEPKRDWRGF